MFFDTEIQKQQKKEESVAFFLGAFFLFLTLKYIAFAFKSLGMGENFYFIIGMLISALNIGAFVLLRKGTLQEIKYNNAKYANAPKYKFKTTGAVFLSIATFLSAFFGNYTLISSLFISISVLAGWYLYYGFDPLKDKIEGYDNTKSAKRIMRLLIEANKDILSIKKYAMQTDSPSISILMHKMAQGFEKIVKHIEDEPQDYNMTRKYLVSYLKELKSMCEIFTKLEISKRTKEIEDDFEQTLLNAIEKLKQHYSKLLDDDITELDIKLAVMKKRLKNEE